MGMSASLAPWPALDAIDWPAFEPGTVWLVGAGPGDPGLLTLHALHALREADWVVYDALVGDVILAMAAPGATREFAGKRGGMKSPRQDDISDRLIERARAGCKVLRLKGGDPFVFGRGGEEALALVEAGIRFRIVPGITAGIGGLAYAAIPATTRDTNKAVILATGHSAQGAIEDCDWAALARTGLPIVLYMGMTFLDEIAAALIEGGLSPETPTAVVADATTPTQRVHITVLGRVKAEAAAEGLKAPAIVAIGANVDLHRVLAPYTLNLGRSP